MKKIAVVFSVILVLFAIIALRNHIKPASTQEKELTLRQAVALAEKEAKKWNPNAQLSFVGSVDNVESAGQVDGIDGKRRYWNLSFVVPNTNDAYGITIHDGQLINPRNSKGPSIVSELPDTSFDSPQALRLAKSVYDLQPGKGWAGGYHFEFTTIKDRPILTVVGRDSSGNFSKIQIDAKKEAIVSAIHKVPSGGGLYKEGSKSPLFYDPSVSLAGGTAFRDDQNQIVIIWGQKTISHAPFIKMSRNGGFMWSDIQLPGKSDILDVEISDNFKTDKVIHIYTLDGIYTSKNGGMTWEERVVDHPPIRDASIQQDHLGVLTEQEVRVSHDGGNTWNIIKPPEKARHIFIDQQGKVYLQTDTEWYFLQESKWVKHPIPFDGQLGEPQRFTQSVLVYTRNAIGIYDFPSGNWIFVDRVSHSLVNVWPDPNYEQTHVLYFVDRNGKAFIRQGGETHELMLYGHGGIVKLMGGQKGEVLVVRMPDQNWENWTRGGN